MNSEALTDLVVDALDDVKAKDIVRLDVRDMTAVTDYMVVASGRVGVARPAGHTGTRHAAQSARVL
jgi:ribosomal silencing factor RsfS